MEILNYKIIKTLVGFLKIVANKNNLIAILWDNEKAGRVKLGLMSEDKSNPLLAETEKQLNEYFRGTRQTFDLPLEIHGTRFQEGVWKLLTDIPYGSTESYKEIAFKMDRAQAVRAAGSAIGRNPLSIVIPCHRVIASNGSLAGFAGGLDRKKILLDLESNRISKALHS